ncbi:MAG: ATP-binding cassette domain-containing protein [Alphaproteobacteria bacterium]|mgnify:FL=1|jgi:simple sugar transport system ATP-binding protein|nr:ATP-binding cassette domain-containing protein [Alphaproteobacteria bacterium]
MNASTFNEVILEAKNVSKFFGTITALKDANLSLRPGEVLGVVGDNGAGKSTLMKVLSGLYNPSEGSIYFEGKEVFFSSPRDSQDLGIEMVYQDLSLAENLPIGDNIFLGREPTRSFGPIKFLDHKKRKQFTEEHLAKLKINVKSADQKVEELSGGQRQAVAIARATAFDAKIVIMDEPTAALAVKEVGMVLDLIIGLKNLGVGVIVISHRMDDIFSVSDRVMALFQGANFAESLLKETSRDEVVGWIMGKKI